MELDDNSSDTGDDILKQRLRAREISEMFHIAQCEKKRLQVRRLCTLY